MKAPKDSPRAAASYGTLAYWIDRAAVEARGPWGKWHLVGDARAYFLVHTGDDYDVALAQIRTQGDMLRWIAQIAAKHESWMPSVDVGDFVRAIMSLGLVSLGKRNVPTRRAKRKASK